MVMETVAGSGLPGPLVLVIEDVDTARAGLGELLEVAGFRVRLAKNGFEAMSLAVEIRPDVILMDLGLPGMDGLETTRHLKRERSTMNIPIIAVTGQAILPDLERLRVKGFADLLTKPCDPKELVSAIRLAAAGHA
jgi:CheY-like chemotaxis protein